MLKSKNQETLFVNYSYSNIYDISSSENVYTVLTRNYAPPFLLVRFSYKYGGLIIEYV